MSLGKGKCNNCEQREKYMNTKGISLKKVRDMKNTNDRPNKYGEVSLCKRCEKTTDWKTLQKDTPKELLKG